MRNRLVFLLAILAVVFAYVGTQVALAPESDTLPILPTPDFSKLTAYPVVRVVDGDIIVVNDKDKDVKVRLVGVDTPETVHPTKPVEHYGKEASRFTTNLLKGEKVYLVGEPLPGALDRYGRTLAYVYRAPDGLFVNAEIIRQGYGHAYAQIPSKHMQEFKQLEQFARKAKKGLWANPDSSTTLPIVKPPKDAGQSLKNDDGLLVDPAFESFDDPHNSPLTVFKKYRNALLTDDLEKVLSCLNPYKRAEYAKIYKKLRPHFAQMAKDMKGLVIESKEDNLVVCDLLREENGEIFGYPVRFAKDADGNWFIEDL